MGSSIGVDIGTCGVRVVEVRTKGKSIAVARAAALPLPEGAVVDGVVVDKGAVTSALRTLWRQNRFRSRKVRLTMGSYQQVLIRLTSVPYVDGGKHMDGIVRNAASTAMPVEIDGLVLSHQVIGLRTELDENDKPVPKADVVLTGAHRSAVSPLIAAVEAAGLRPVAVDVTAFALTRFVTAAGSGPGRIDFILHMGADTVLLIGVRDGQFVSVQAMDHYAGDLITGAVVDAAALTRVEAEKLKINAANPGALHGGAEVIESLLAAWTSAIVNETKAAITEASRNLGLAVGRVWVSGGGAGLPSITPRLGAEIGGGATVAHLDPTTWVSSPDKLLRASQSSGADLTVALATAIQ